jgi:NAD(P)-dependent dehydrogenase (short-subunit alcohol dehydrogenase family)
LKSLTRRLFTKADRSLRPSKGIPAPFLWTKRRCRSHFGQVSSAAFFDTGGVTRAQAVTAVPMGRLGTPDEVARAAVFLAPDDSSYVTGIELFVDGGVAQA